MWQFLVGQAPTENMSIKGQAHHWPLSLRISATVSCEVIQASMPRKLGGNRACGRLLCLGCIRKWCGDWMSVLYETQASVPYFNGMHILYSQNLKPNAKYSYRVEVGGFQGVAYEFDTIKDGVVSESELKSSLPNSQNYLGHSLSQQGFWVSFGCPNPQKL